MKHVARAAGRGSDFAQRRLADLALAVLERDEEIAALRADAVRVAELHAEELEAVWSIVAQVRAASTRGTP